MKSAILTTQLEPVKPSLCARIKAHDCCGNSVTLTVQTDDDIEQAHRNAALLLAQVRGWKGTYAMGKTLTGYALVFINEGETS